MWDDTKKSRIARTLRAISCVASVIVFLSLLGTGYVDVKLQVAPQRPDVSRHLEAPLDYKGQVRFVSPMDARINAVARSFMIAAAGVAVVTGMIWVIITRR